MVYTDYKNQEYFHGARTTSRRHARRAETLAVYDFTIVYKKGETNGKLDALSRRPDYQPDPIPELPILPDSLSPISPPDDFPILFPPPPPSCCAFHLPHGPHLTCYP